MSAESEIRMVVENWAAAVRNRDIHAVMSHHSENLVMYDVPFPFESIGLEAYRKTWTFFFSNTEPGVFDIKELNIVADERVAFCYASMKCSDRKDSGEFVELPFRLTIGFIKKEDQWIIVHEHHSIPAA